MKPHKCPNDHKVEWCSEHIAYCRECCDENRMAWYFTDGFLVPYMDRSIYELVMSIVLLRQKIDETSQIV